MFDMYIDDNPDNDYVSTLLQKNTIEKVQVFLSNPPILFLMQWSEMANAEEYGEAEIREHVPAEFIVGGRNDPRSMGDYGSIPTVQPPLFSTLPSPTTTKGMPPPPGGVVDRRVLTQQQVKSGSSKNDGHHRHGHHHHHTAPIPRAPRPFEIERSTANDDGQRHASFLQIESSLVLERHRHRHSSGSTRDDIRRGNVGGDDGAEDAEDTRYPAMGGGGGGGTAPQQQQGMLSPQLLSQLRSFLQAQTGASQPPQPQQQGVFPFFQPQQQANPFMPQLQRFANPTPARPALSPPLLDDMTGKPLPPAEVASNLRLLGDALGSAIHTNSKQRNGGGSNIPGIGGANGLPNGGIGQMPALEGSGGQGVLADWGAAGVNIGGPAGASGGPAPYPGGMMGGGGGGSGSSGMQIMGAAGMVDGGPFPGMMGGSGGGGGLPFGGMPGGGGAAMGLSSFPGGMPGMSAMMGSGFGGGGGYPGGGGMFDSMMAGGYPGSSSPNEGFPPGSMPGTGQSVPGMFGGGAGLPGGPPPSFPGGSAMYGFAQDRTASTTPYELPVPGANQYNLRG